MKSKSVIKATLLVSLIAILSKVIGFLREAIIAAYYGASASTDAYFFAQNMPGMIFPAVCSSLSTAFISLYVSKTVKKGEKEGDIFASRALTIALMISLVLSIMAFFLLPYFVPVFAPGFDKATVELAIKLSRITMGSFVLTMAQYMLTAVLNSKKFFYGAQISGVIQSMIVIIVTLLFGKGQSVELLSWTVVAGLVVQVLILFSFAKKKAQLSFNGKINHDIKKMIVIALPILLGNSIVQINSIVDRFLASSLKEGAVSALSYSNSLNSIVTSVFIVSLSTVLYPALTEHVSSKNYALFGENILKNLIILLIIITPISIITIISSKDIVSFVFERGNFNEGATNLTAMALKYYAVGYTFIAIREITIRGFYALGDTKTPMYNGILAVVINIISSVVLIRFMGIGGLALGSAISAFISAILMIKSIKKKIRFISVSDLYPTFIKLLLSAIIMILVQNFFYMYTSSFIPLLRFMSSCVLGLIIYWVVLYYTKCKELDYILSLIKRKYRKLNNK